MTKIKICGITNLADARLALSLGADAIGFNFVEESPRFISPIDAQAIVRMLSPEAWFVGVFASREREKIEEICRQVPLDTIQLHGDESPEFCAKFQEWRVIKAIRLHAGIDEEFVNAYAKAADCLLFDAFRENALGGTGEEIEEKLLEKLKVSKVLSNSFLAGGLTPENVAQKIKQYAPFGVDVASGVEALPGKKNPELLKDFFSAVQINPRG